MADIASRLNKGSIEEPTVTSPVEKIIIRNAQGIRIDYAYFRDMKRGTLAPTLLSRA